VAEQDAVFEPGTELRPEDACPFMDGDDRLPGEAERGEVRAAACEVLAQRDDRHEADHADEDDHALNDAKATWPIATLS
jgi:hypothetical protein